MAKSIKRIGILVAISVLLLLFLYVNRIEGFADATIPAVCGTYGFKFAMEGPGTVNRMYTKSGCDKLGGTESNMNCFKLKNPALAGDKFVPENIDVNYSELCAGLNNTPTMPPDECYPRGDTTAEGPGYPMGDVTINGVKHTEFNGRFRLYTTDQCKLLGGTTRPIDDEHPDMMLCEGGGINYSFTCAALNHPDLLPKPTFGQQIKQWVNSMF